MPVDSKPNVGVTRRLISSLCSGSGIFSFGSTVDL